MVLPFHDYDSGKLLLARVKPDRPRMRTRGARKRPIKYEQAPATGAVPYIPPRTLREQRLDDPTRPIVWVEGEKKALLLDELGFAVIGLTGSHNWNDSEKYRNGDGLTWSKPLRKYGERFVRGRRHVICFDSDAFVNDNVVLAMRRLAGLLLDGGAASVSVVRVPPDPKDEERGRGIDDYHVEEGHEASARVLAALGAYRARRGANADPAARPAAESSARSHGCAARNSIPICACLRVSRSRRDRSLWAEPPPDKPDADTRELMRGVVLPSRMLRELGEGEEERLEIAYFASGHMAARNRRSESLSGRAARPRPSYRPPSR